MDLITRRFGGVKQDYPVYTQEEALEEGLGPVYWKEATVGDWAESDDGYVGRCMKHATYEDKDGGERAFITLVYARAWISENATIYYEERKEKGAFSATSAKTWVELEAGKTRTKQMANLLAEMMVVGKIDYQVLGRAYRDDQERPDLTVKRLLKQEIIQEMVQEKLRQKLKDEGVEEEDVIQMFTETFEAAKELGQTATMARVAENMAKMLAMEPDKKKAEVSEEFAYDQVLTEKAEQHTVTGKQTLQIEE